MTRLSRKGERFLRNLLNDRSGNTLAIAAASLLPMMALIGGGVDISRTYMGRTELQAACDSGVLAGRRALSKSGSYGAAEKAKATAMFNFNFNATGLDVENVSFTTTDNEDGEVRGVATATLPTLIMRIFEKDTVELSVNCMAELQIGNADIMFVLDSTGSMGGSKIQGLRDAVEDFHKTINQAVNDNRTRIRYGFVPYSVTVNAKNLVSSGAMPTAYFKELSGYQTRVANFHNQVWVEDTQNQSTQYETYSEEISENDCYNYGNNRYPNWGSNPIKDGTAPNPVTSYEYDFENWQYTRRVGRGWWKTKVGWCTRKINVAYTTYDTAWEFSGWDYRWDDIDTSNFRDLKSVPYVRNLDYNARVDVNGSYDPVELAKKVDAGETENIDSWDISSSTWDGCLEERQTVAEWDFDPIPDGALDLSISLIPDDDKSETQWVPRWRDQVWTSNNPSAPCPAEMMLLREVTLTDGADDVPGWLHTYLNGLVATGNTYHDIGMIWGGRLTSPNGIFAENVNKDAEKISVSKHIIFMTDGQMQPSTSVYSAYGVENYYHRIAPPGDSWSVTSRHNARFSAVCEEIKSEGTTIWVVAFGTSMTDELRGCASNGRAYYSSNSEALRNTFKYIAAQVADLRLGE